MIKIIILNSLRDQIYKTFKKDSVKVYKLLRSLKQNPGKGKVLGHAGDISIRELKYRSYRFYYIINANRLILFCSKKIEELLIEFIAMSKKNNQQEVIDEIKAMLKLLK